MANEKLTEEQVNALVKENPSVQALLAHVSDKMAVLESELNKLHCGVVGNLLDSQYQQDSVGEAQRQATKRIANELEVITRALGGTMRRLQVMAKTD